jgi:hypothetical protein
MIRDAEAAQVRSIERDPLVASLEEKPGLIAVHAVAIDGTRRRDCTEKRDAMCKERRLLPDRPASPQMPGKK